MTDLDFSTRAALAYTRQGRLEEWIHAYLLGGPWANRGLADGLRLQERWWRGPFEAPLAQLIRCYGPEPDLEYVAEPASWEARISALAEGIRASRATPLDLPPLICNFVGGIWSVRDGNHRHAAVQRLGWASAWTFIWYNSLEECQQDSAAYEAAVLNDREER